MNYDDRIEIKLPRCAVILTVGEVLALLRESPAIWAAGLQRGKGLQRQRQVERRIERGTHSDYR
jgi:hypothetical protein